MANRDIIARMHRLLDAYEASEVGPEQLEKSVQFHMEALEALPYQRIKEAGSLCHRLVTAHMFMGEEVFIDHEDVSEVLRDFRVSFDSLPGGPAG
ncbi:MAG TPA: hypothetical protein VMV10_32720 [Pirellulales bacterium]|nr:hypothetical protein [Pirellulales bacterium]